MGFRSVFISEHYSIEWPAWFVERWKESVFFDEDNKGLIASRFEGKMHDLFSEIFTDVQKVLKARECNNSNREKLVFVILHECRGITRVEVHQDKIWYSEPKTWDILYGGGPSHSYCYECSDI